MSCPVLLHVHCSATVVEGSPGSFSSLTNTVLWHHLKHLLLTIPKGTFFLLPDVLAVLVSSLSRFTCCPPPSTDHNDNHSHPRTAFFSHHPVFRLRNLTQRCLGDELRYPSVTTENSFPCRIRFEIKLFYWCLPSYLPNLFFLLPLSLWSIYRLRDESGHWLVFYPGVSDSFPPRLRQ